MARYCFYCGRELEPDEKCTCRTSGSAGGSGPSGAKAGGSGASGAGPKASRTAPPPPPPRPKQQAPRKSGFFKAFFGFFAGPPKPPKASRPGAGYAQRPTKGPATPPGVFLRARLSEFGGFFVRPAQTIRRVAGGTSTGTVVLYLLLQAVVSAGAALAFSGRAAMDGFLAFLLTGGVQGFRTATDLAGGGALVAPAVFASVVLQDLALAGILALALRFLLRTPVSFRRVLGALAPAAFFNAALTLLALVSSLGASLPATQLLLAGLVLGFVALFLGLLAVTGQGEDRVLALLFFSLLLFYAFLAVLSGYAGALFPAATTPIGTGTGVTY